MRKPHILLSNDDSVHASGLKKLYDSLRRVARVTVVAPLEEKSTTGHSLTLHKPLRLIEMEKDIYGVSGSPADCVYMAFREVLKKKPDLVISGINRGANLGQDVYYSGTVSAAREACMLGIPSIAVSLAIDFNKKAPENVLNYDTAAIFIKKFLPHFLKMKIPEHTLLNVNVPDVSWKSVQGAEFVRQGFRYYDGKIIRRVDHRGKPYFWVGGMYQGYRKEEGTDCNTVSKKKVSIVPIQLDTTEHVLRLQLDRKFSPVLEKGSSFWK